MDISSVDIGRMVNYGVKWRILLRKNLNVNHCRVAKYLKTKINSCKEEMKMDFLDIGLPL